MTRFVFRLPRRTYTVLAASRAAALAEVEADQESRMP